MTVARETGGGWAPIELELVDGEWLARVKRDLYGGRWRWSVTPLEQADKWPSMTVESAKARGYSGTRERAIEMAEMAIAALKKAKAEK